MDFDAFSGGVEPGGLRNSSEIKLLVCYLLKSVDCGLTKSLILDAIQDNGLANYFETANAIADLVATGSILETQSADDPIYHLTEKGTLIADTLSETLPLSVRDKSIRTALLLTTRIKRERENRVEFKPLEKGVMVDCHISDDGEKDMMCVSVRVPDLLQAKLIKSRFQSDPVLLYKGIIALFTGENELVRDVFRQLQSLEEKDKE